jgi:hypothetical protein
LRRTGIQEEIKDVDLGIGAEEIRGGAGRSCYSIWRSGRRRPELLEEDENENGGDRGLCCYSIWRRRPVLLKEDDEQLDLEWERIELERDNRAKRFL